MYLASMEQTSGEVAGSTGEFPERAVDSTPDGGNRLVLSTEQLDKVARDAFWWDLKRPLSKVILGVLFGLLLIIAVPLVLLREYGGLVVVVAGVLGIVGGLYYSYLATRRALRKAYPQDFAASAQVTNTGFISRVKIGSAEFNLDQITLIELTESAIMFKVRGNRRNLCLPRALLTEPDQARLRKLGSDLAMAKRQR